MKISANSLCPCGSLKKYKKCCKVFHEGAKPSTSLELMRSRYTAFALKKDEYIINTTHQKNPDFTSDIKAWKEDILAFCNGTSFEKLEILEFIDRETQSFVTFKASLKQGNTDVSFTEKSRFLKENNKWFYVDGTFL